MKTVRVLLVVMALGAWGGTARAAVDGYVTMPDGTRLHYLEAGQGPAMLLVPGWTMPASIWNAQIEHFSTTFRVIAIDPRGQGLSTKATEGLHPAQRGRDLATVIQRLNLSPVVLVGWSMGVAEIAAYVAQFGTRSVSAIVMVDGTAGGPPEWIASYAMLQWVGGLQRSRLVQTYGFVASMFRTPQSGAYLFSVTEGALKTPTSVAVALMVGWLTTDYRASLAAIDKPTLIVATGAPWDDAYQDMHERIPGSRIERFVDAGHALFVDEADRFNALVRQFLGRP